SFKDLVIVKRCKSRREHRQDEKRNSRLNMIIPLNGIRYHSLSVDYTYTLTKKTGYVDLSLLVLSSYKTTVNTLHCTERDWLMFIWCRK
ncbi:unnamed protein product, partial [Brassica oleracea var. botrytis]